MQQDYCTWNTGCMLAVAHYLDHWITFRGYSTCCSVLVAYVPRLLIESDAGFHFNGEISYRP